MKNTTDKNLILENFTWLNEPQDFAIQDNGLEITTDDKTDFWQNTHYGFVNKNGHFLCAENPVGFEFGAKFNFVGKNQYDQTGLMIMIDEENWVKCSTEYENEEFSRLGSVVTNFAYSDWATQNIASNINEIYYKMKVLKPNSTLENTSGADVEIYYSFDGKNYNQLRICHLHKSFEKIKFGFYACSPIKGGYKAKVSDVFIN